jgi:Uncharacterised protein family (UPF0236)
MKELTKNHISTREATMDCMPSNQGKESLVQVAVTYAQVLAERLYARMTASEVVLEGMEKAVLEELHGFGHELLRSLVELREARYPSATIACECGAEAHYQRKRSGQCKTLLGSIKVKRAYYLCARCHRGSCPVDKQIGFCAGSISAGLDELLALLGCQFSFAHSAEMVKRLTLVEVSPNCCRRSTQELGRLVAEEEEQTRQQVWESSTLQLPTVDKETIDPLYVSADGVTVHTRENGWREHCVGAVYTAQRSHPPSAEIRSQAHSYRTELGSRPKFGQQLWVEAHRRGVQKAKTVVFIGDGAQWLWEMAHDLFPEAIQILDWYHATTYLWAVAGELHNEEQAVRQWMEPRLAALAQSNLALVLEELQQLATSSAAARSALTYFTNNQARMDYARYRKLNLHIGSGTIESACKHLIDARLKQAGMRWNLENARCLAKLRARFKSQRWQETIALRPLPSRSYSRLPLC